MPFLSPSFPYRRLSEPKRDIYQFPTTGTVVSVLPDTTARNHGPVGDIQQPDLSHTSSFLMMA